MPILQDANGLSIKFFIQKDIAEDLQAELCETIATLGGRVEAKVPRQGYILVQPGTAEEERLRLCWTSPDRPDRFFVPYTYVEACKIAGMLLKQIFLENGVPIAMHIHQSIANINARNALSQRIMHSGGDPHASANSARVILADQNTDVFQHLVKTYQSTPGKYIESFTWVKKCVERGIVAYTPVVYKNPGGRRAGEERTPFTDDDEQHLATWIATKIPYKETGGRTGNRLYQQLCEMSAEPEYAWVTRHTWQSWRERYKKHATRFDALISTIVAQTKPAQGEKGQYGYVRQAEEKPKKPRKSRKKKNPEPEPTPADDFVIGDEAELGDLFGSDPADPAGTLELAPVAGPSKVQNVRRSPAEEEMDDEESEWAVRVGNSPPPLWAGEKRKARNSEEAASPSKRTKSDEPIPSQNGQKSRSVHVIDEGIRDIALDFQFTADEVRAFYNQCGDMERTRTRFKNMRDLLSARFSDD